MSYKRQIKLQTWKHNTGKYNMYEY